MNQLIRAGGPIPWPQGVNSLPATYEYISIQCYNDRNEPVPKWPNVDSNPVSKSAPASQPTSAAQANAAREGNGGNGAAAAIVIPTVEGLPKFPTSTNGAMKSLYPCDLLLFTMLLALVC